MSSAYGSIIALNNRRRQSLPHRSAVRLLPLKAMKEAIGNSAQAVGNRLAVHANMKSAYSPDFI